MKKRIITTLILIFFSIVIYFLCFKKENIKIDNLVFEYNSKIKISNIIDEYNKDTEYLDTSSLGIKKILIKDKRTNYSINYKVVDTTPPVILISNTISTNIGNKINLIDKAICADNYDDSPKCYIDGKYDLNKVGTYNLKYVAVDSSNNKKTKKFKLLVTNNSSSYSNNTAIKKTKISNVIKKYKNNNTMIGIDVSSWQDNIDFNKVKKSGVEFVIIRIGFGNDDKNNIVLDNTFYNNLRNAKEAGLLVGLYFYSYAKSEEEAINQAKWIIEKLDNFKLDLPIAFDWENWSNYNSYHISITKLNNIANSFMSEIKNSGYDTMLYGSYYYLENMWDIENKNIWLAHYAKKTDYPHDYYLWQFSNTGKVDGINTDVDLDILYKNKN